MPTKRSHRDKRVDPDLLEDQLMHLQYGWDFFGTGILHGFTGKFPFKDDAHRREMWRENKRQLMSTQPDGFDPVGAVREVGTVPRAWWDYEATPEQRRVHEEDLEADRKKEEREMRTRT